MRMTRSSTAPTVLLVLTALAAGWVAQAEETVVGYNRILENPFSPGSEPPEASIVSFGSLDSGASAYWPQLPPGAPGLAFVAYPQGLYLYQSSPSLHADAWTTWAGFNNLYGYDFLTVQTGLEVDDSPQFVRVVTVEDGANATLPPPQYTSFEPPAAGEWFTDPIFGTPIKRLTDEQNIYGFNGERSMFSVDDQYFVVAVDPPERLRLFDGRTGEVIRDLPLSLPNRTIVRWSYDPQMLVYASGNKLMGFNVVTDASTTLATFSEPIGDADGRLCGGDGNDFDDAGEWLLLNKGDRMFAYNIRTGETGPEKDMSGYAIDYCTISASGDYIVGNTRDQGTLLWQRDWTFVRQLLPGNQHMDIAYLDGTDECVVSRITGGGILAVRFSDGAVFTVLESDSWLHLQFSAVGGSNRQHINLAIESRGLDPTNGWYRYFGELVQVPLVSTGTGTSRRLAHHRARPTDGSTHLFHDQPEAWLNHAGDRLFFRSNMDNYAERGKHDLYMIELGPLPDDDWVELLYDDFEGGFGNWIDGGANCLLYTGGRRAHQGSQAVNLQDDTDTSVMSTADLALSGYSAVKVEFWYFPRSMDNSNEDFWLQISTDGGVSYRTVQSWARDIDFTNWQFFAESVVISGDTLTDQTRLRFRCDASDTEDDVYIDEVRVSVQ
jgi:hypothetical protein